MPPLLPGPRHGTKCLIACVFPDGLGGRGWLASGSYLGQPSPHERTRTNVLREAHDPRGQRSQPQAASPARRTGSGSWNAGSMVSTRGEPFGRTRSHVLRFPGDANLRHQTSRIEPERASNRHALSTSCRSLERARLRFTRDKVARAHRPPCSTGTTAVPRATRARSKCNEQPSSPDPS